MNKVGAIDPNRPGEICSHYRVAGSVNRPYLKIVAIALFIFGLTSCATISRHQFAEPARDWQTRSGQLLYRTTKTTLIGDVLVRFSKNGDFELSFSKGPGLTLLTLHQDAAFAEVKGPLVRGGWQGPVAQAPPQMRGWLELRDKIIHSQDRKEVRHSDGGETFVFHF